MRKYSIWIECPPSVGSWHCRCSEITMWLPDSETLDNLCKLWKLDDITVLSAMEIQDYRDLKC